LCLIPVRPVQPFPGLRRVFRKPFPADIADEPDPGFPFAHYRTSLPDVEYGINRFPFLTFKYLQSIEHASGNDFTFNVQQSCDGWVHFTVRVLSYVDFVNLPHLPRYVPFSRPFIHGAIAGYQRMTVSFQAFDRGVPDQRPIPDRVRADRDGMNGATIRYYRRVHELVKGCHFRTTFVSSASIRTTRTQLRAQAAAKYPHAVMRLSSRFHFRFISSSRILISFSRRSSVSRHLFISHQLL
jgi:hypothetical protein